MNERNVEALAALLRQRCQETHDPACGCSHREDAEWFASRGVLVPEALDVKLLTRAYDVAMACMSENEFDWNDVEEYLRDALTRIAKGEA